MLTDEKDAARVQRIQRSLEQHWLEGLILAVRVRNVCLIALCFVICWQVSWPELFFYLSIAILLIVIGSAQLRFIRSSDSWLAIALLFLEFSLLVIVASTPNPLSDDNLPPAFTYNFDIYKFIFIFLATTILAFSWRVILAISIWTAFLWLISTAIVHSLTIPDVEMADRLVELFPQSSLIRVHANPYLVKWELRIQEAVTILLCGIVLSAAVHRVNRLLTSFALLERNHANLSQYFSPNMIESLSQNDEPLKQTRSQLVAVLFVDLVGFTRYASERSPNDIIQFLREIHGLLEKEVFRHEGTLDKYLGDGLMATFGTPVASEHDACNALRCVASMIKVTKQWNDQRESAGLDSLNLSFGLHYGPVVLGDIGGSNRLEYAVVGNTVNIASRLEAQTRKLDAQLVISDLMLERARFEGFSDSQFLDGLVKQTPQHLPGVPEPITIWARKAD